MPCLRGTRGAFHHETGSGDGLSIRQTLSSHDGLTRRICKHVYGTYVRDHVLSRTFMSASRLANADLCGWCRGGEWKCRNHFLFVARTGFCYEPRLVLFGRLLLRRRAPECGAVANE